jgi:hypothetical protein
MSLLAGILDRAAILLSWRFSNDAKKKGSSRKSAISRVGSEAIARVGNLGGAAGGAAKNGHSSIPAYLT